MKFHLTYAGPLKSDGKPRHKNDIRKIIHAQLRNLWEQNESLYGKPMAGFSTEERKTAIVRDRPDKHTKYGIRWMPLIDADDDARIAIDILLLRQGPSGGLISQTGDIDNRLKTLFDALQIPPHQNQFDDRCDAPDDDCFHVLLEDDSLIGKISVDTDTLLEPVPGRLDIDNNDVRLIITVHVHALSGWGRFT